MRRRSWSNNIRTMILIISGTHRVLYSLLKLSNVSLNIILRDIYSHTESNNKYLTSDLENKLKQTHAFDWLWQTLRLFVAGTEWLGHGVRIISERSCDTEEWGNGCKKIQLCHHKNKLHFIIFKN